MYALLENDATADFDPTFLLLVVILFALVGVVALLYQLNARAASVEERLENLDRLKSIEGGLGRIAEDSGQLDLRRLEHVLIDVRDGQRRLEERLISTIEALNDARDIVLTPASADGARAQTAGLGERVTTRLLALGYERIEILTPSTEFDDLLDGDGELLVEARKGGALHKGRIALHRGAIAEVHMRPTYEAFP